MNKKRKWKTIEKLYDRFSIAAKSVLDGEVGEDEEGDVAAAISLAYPLIMRALAYALDCKELIDRRIYRRMKKNIPRLCPPLKKDYTPLFETVRRLAKTVTYFEDEDDLNVEIESISKEVTEFIADVRKMAAEGSDTAK